MRLQKSLGHARFKYNLGSLVTPCGKGRPEERKTVTEEDKTRKSKWKIRVAERKSESAGKGKKRVKKRVERER